MNALDSPLEALAINYVRFGLLAVVNNLWTWVAVVTAAVSFWRIRATATSVRAAAAVGCSSMPEPQSPHEDACSSSNECRSVLQGKPRPSRQADDVSSRGIAALAHPLVAVSSKYDVTKGRFTVYYEDDRDVNHNQNEEAEATATVGAEKCDGGIYGSRLEWSGRRDMVFRVRNGDSGWYRYQDLKVFDGSVVRLWDDAHIVPW
ncbi:uncharacterized protein LOC116189550 [Punica granatum]|uniref:Uncharacterized protein n=2 Tax=Punica granatum TaxID=22663 RepID=A0A218XGL5_PUNGR|nr:uncharacterized protein LOC116189550 [Punica granatum]OWM84064.1 hypothetical protein CDL15_Pgr009311 [Punica granatum]PKI76042.1 hypothetical protein CRG98_003592 [Punica granatum]